MPAAERVGVESYFGISDFTKNAGIYDNTLRNLEKSTAKYGKSVEKSTEGAEESWESYIKNLSKIIDVQQDEIDSLSKDLKKFADGNKKATKGAETSWSQFSKSMIGQVANVKASIDAARFAIQAFIGPFKQFIALGTQAIGLERTQDRFRDLVGGAEAYTEAMEDMREATQGTIKDAQLIDSAFNMLRRGYADTAASAATLSRNIALTAQMAGQVPTPEAAMQVFSLMMSNQSRMRVDAFGLTIEQVDSRIARLKDTLKKTEEEAFSLAIIQLLDEQVGDLGLTVETATTKLQKMEVQFANLGDGLKLTVIPYFEDFVNTVTAGSGDMTGALKFVEGSLAVIAGMVRAAAAMFGEVVQAFVMGGAAITEALKGNIATSQDFAAAAIQSVKEVVTFQPAITAMATELDRVYGETADASDASARAQAKALAEVEQAWADLEKAMKKYNDELIKVQDAMAQQAGQRMAAEIYKVQDVIIAVARRREEIARQTAARIEAIETALAAATAKAHQAYQQSIQQIERQNADQRLQIERDYQKRKRDIMRNFAVSEEKAIRDRDALALSVARDTRDQELTEAEEQRNEQMAKAEESMRNQTEAAQAALNQQLQAAQDAYVQQLQQLQTSLQEQEAEYQRAQQQREEDEERARAREEGRRRQALGSKITDIYLANQEELTAAQQHYNSLTRELQQYYANVVQYYAAIAQITGSSQGIRPGTGGPIQGYQAVGGYAVSPGTYVRGESGTEFVMNASTTRAMEGGLGGGITQMDLQRLASSLSGGSSTVNHNVSGEISGAISVAVSQGIKGMEGRIMAGVNRNMRELFRVRQ